MLLVCFALRCAGRFYRRRKRLILVWEFEAITKATRLSEKNRKSRIEWNAIGIRIVLAFNGNNYDLKYTFLWQIYSNEQWEKFLKTWLVLRTIAELLLHLRKILFINYKEFTWRCLCRNVRKEKSGDKWLLHWQAPKAIKTCEWPTKICSCDQSAMLSLYAM